MRAGRLVSILLILQRRGRVTAEALARELEVSPRTILRDMDELSGAGVPVTAARGHGGGFELLEGYRVDLAAPRASSAIDRAAAPGRRATVRITPEGRRIAAVIGVLQPLRLSRDATPDAAGRLEATFRVRSHEGMVIDLLALGPEVEVIGPAELRDALAVRTHAMAALYPPPART